MGSSPTSGQVLTGTQVPIDAANIADLGADNYRALMEMLGWMDPATLGLTDTTGFNTNGAGWISTAQQNQWQQEFNLAKQESAQRASQAAASYAAQAKSAQAAMKNDAARLGLEKANLAFQQKMAQAQMDFDKEVFAAQYQLDQMRFGNETAALNFQQRMGEAQVKLQSLELLASRSGPQDWVAYNSLLNNMSAPQGTTVDPYGLTAGLSQEIQMAVQQGMQGGGGGLLPGGNAGFGNTQTPGATIDQNGVIPGSTNGTNGGGRAANTPMGRDGPFTGGGGGIPQPEGLTKPVVNMPAASATQQPKQPGFMSPDAMAAYQQSNREANPAYAAKLDARANPVTPIPMGEDSIEVPAGPVARPGMPFTTGVGGVAGGGLLPQATLDTDYANPAAAAAAGINGTLDPRKYQVGVGGAMRANEGGLLPGGTAVVTGDRPGQRTGVEEMVYSQTPITVVPMGNRPLPPEIPRAASGGTYGMPETPTYTQYTPEQLGNQPFIQKLRGERPAEQFGGFGASLSNPSLGIDNMPSSINLQTYMSLLPSERDQTSSLYQQGLGVDFRDLLEQSRRASPFGVSFGAARYGG